MTEPVDGSSHAPDDAGLEAIARTHEWFEANSGWAPPDPDTLLDWAAEDIARAPDECWVDARGICGHGLASWPMVLAALDEA